MYHPSLYNIPDDTVFRIAQPIPEAESCNIYSLKATANPTKAAFRGTLQPSHAGVCIIHPCIKTLDDTVFRIAQPIPEAESCNIYSLKATANPSK